MKKTPFTHKHIANDAKMAPFAGYDMPIEFTGINDEHAAVREKSGLFDVSHMGEIWVKGPNALDFIQSVTTNDAGVLVDGKIQYTCMLNDAGGIIDDLLVYRFGPEKYLLVVNAGNTDKVWEHLRAHAAEFGLKEGEELVNESCDIAQIALQGPAAVKIISELTSYPSGEMEYYTFSETKVAGVDAILSATGYTGSGGFEVYVRNEDAEALWDAVVKAGQEYGLQPVGLGARDTLRLEMGFCLHGNDITQETNPLEAGLGWVVKMVDGKDFVGRKVLENIKSKGVARKLVGFEMIDRGIPRHGYEIADPEGNIIGEVTSGTMSPTLKKGIGMGYVLSDFATVGTEINIIVRGKMLRAQVVSKPFYKK